MPRKRKLPPRGQYVKLGDCYEAAGQYVLGQSKLYMDPSRNVGGTAGDASSLVLVHAEVAGQGPMEGQTFGHGFVWDKITDTIIDQSNNRDLRIPKMLYYAIAGIEEINNYHEYTPEQMMVNMIKYRHWGPWDLKTSSGL